MGLEDLFMSEENFYGSSIMDDTIKDILKTFGILAIAGAIVGGVFLAKHYFPEYFPKDNNTNYTQTTNSQDGGYKK